jgi:hypothetical protein
MRNASTKYRVARASVLLACLAPAIGLLRASTLGASKPEEIEWTWSVRPPQADPSLPNVLLVGDSISRNYFPGVQRRLKGSANVYLMASSICVGDPRLQQELLSFARMEHVRFRVVHFNNGMHGWNYSEAEYKAGFHAYLAALHSIAPGARFIWTTTTPVKADLGTGASNARIDARNAIAREFTRNMAVDDQHALMEKHPELYQDNVHFNHKGADIEGDQAADAIKMALEAAPAHR